MAGRTWIRCKNQDCLERIEITDGYPEKCESCGEYVEKPRTISGYKCAESSMKPLYPSTMNHSDALSQWHGK